MSQDIDMNASMPSPNSVQATHSPSPGSVVASHTVIYARSESPSKRVPPHLSPPPSPTKTANNLLIRTASAPILSLATAIGHFHEPPTPPTPLTSSQAEQADEADEDTSRDALGADLLPPPTSASINYTNELTPRTPPIAQPKPDPLLQQALVHMDPEDSMKEQTRKRTLSLHKTRRESEEVLPVASIEEEERPNGDHVDSLPSKGPRSTLTDIDFLHNIHQMEQAPETNAYDESAEKTGGGKQESSEDEKDATKEGQEQARSHREKKKKSQHGSDSDAGVSMVHGDFNQDVTMVDNETPSNDPATNPSDSTVIANFRGWGNSKPPDQEQEDIDIAIAISRSLDGSVTTSDKEALQITEDALFAQALLESTRLITHLPPSASTTESPATLALKSELGAFTLSLYSELGKVPRWEIVSDLLGDEVGGARGGGGSDGGVMGGWVQGAGWEVRQGELGLSELDEGDFTFKGSEWKGKGKEGEEDPEKRKKKGKVDYLNTLFTYLALVKVPSANATPNHPNNSSSDATTPIIDASEQTKALLASDGKDILSSPKAAVASASTPISALVTVSRDNALKVLARLNPNNVFAYLDSDDVRTPGDDQWLQEECRVWCRRLGEEMGLWEEARKRRGLSGEDELGERMGAADLDKMDWQGDGIEEEDEEEAEEVKKDAEYDCCESESETGIDEEWERCSNSTTGKEEDHLEQKEEEMSLEEEKMHHPTSFELAVKRSNPRPVLSPPMSPIDITTFPLSTKPSAIDMPGDRIFQSISLSFPTFSPAQIRSMLCDTLEVVLGLRNEADRPAFFRLPLEQKMHLHPDELVYATSEKDYIKKMRKVGTWTTKVELSILALRFEFDVVIFKASGPRSKKVERERLVDKDGLLNRHGKPVAFFQMGEDGPYETDPCRHEFGTKGTKIVSSIFTQLDDDAYVIKERDEARLKVFDDVEGLEEEGTEGGPGGIASGKALGDKMEVANADFVMI